MIEREYLGIARCQRAPTWKHQGRVDSQYWKRRRSLDRTHSRALVESVIRERRGNVIASRVVEHSPSPTRGIASAPWPASGGSALLHPRRSACASMRAELSLRVGAAHRPPLIDHYACGSCVSDCGRDHAARPASAVRQADPQDVRQCDHSSSWRARYGSPSVHPHRVGTLCDLAASPAVRQNP